jgi:hypothetical protein
VLLSGIRGLLRPPASHWLLGFLILGLLFQVGALKRKGPPQVSGPQIGDTLPTIELRAILDGELFFLKEAFRNYDPCGLLVVFSSSCVACDRLRVTWNDRYRSWVDSVGVPIPVVWASGENEPVLRKFLDGTDLVGVRVARLLGGSANTARALGVVGMPQAILIDSEGQFQSSALGRGLPSAERTRDVCRRPDEA